MDSGPHHVFIQRGEGAGGLEFPQPPPRNLEIEYGYYCFITGIKQ